MTRSPRHAFELWLGNNGAEVLDTKQNEFARFRAHGILCIVYEPNRRARQSCVPELAGQAFDAWGSRKPMDLTNPAEPEGGVEDWKVTGRALVALGRRAIGGEQIDLNQEAAALGIAPERIVRSLKAQKAPVPEPSR